MFLLIWRPDGSRLTPRLVVAERKGRCGSGGVRQAGVVARERLFNEKYHLFKKSIKLTIYFVPLLGNMTEADLVLYRSHVGEYGDTTFKGHHSRPYRSRSGLSRRRHFAGISLVERFSDRFVVGEQGRVALAEGCARS
jgi:hypothetical protein